MSPLFALHSREILNIILLVAPPARTWCSGLGASSARSKNVEQAKPQAPQPRIVSTDGET